MIKSYKGCLWAAFVETDTVLAFDEDLEKLEGEFLILLNNFDIIEQHTGYHHYVEFRAKNYC